MAKKRRQVTDAEQVAYHEAGHVVAAYCLKMRFCYVSVDPRDLGGEAGGGKVAVSRSVSDSLRDTDCGDVPRSRVESFIRVLLAGMIGEGLLSGEYDWRENEQDFQVALQLAGHMSGGADEQVAYVTWLWESTKNLLSHGWQKGAVHCLAEALLKDEKIGYRKARATIATARMAYESGRVDGG
jgi:ATP-dependent Zn protease